jgi:starvation-inducible DNA-binding protein
MITEHPTMTKDTTDRMLDRALEATFPASDAVAIAGDQQADGDRSSDAASTPFETIAADLRVLLADVLTLFVKTKNFHWHVSGPHFRDHHRLFEEHAKQLLSMIDPVAERGRKLGHASLRSLAEATGLRRLSDDERTSLSARDMLQALLTDNRALARSLRATHSLCDRGGDVATASLIENWIDQAESRAWVLAAMTSCDEVSTTHA